MDGMVKALNKLPNTAGVNSAMTQLQASPAASSMSQTTLNSISNTNATVRTQFTSFRMGNLSAASSGMASPEQQAAAFESVDYDLDEPVIPK